MKRTNQQPAEELTLEVLKKRMRENQDEMQEQFIAKLLDQVEYLAEKSVRKDYEPTVKEKEMFSKIHAYITSMGEWF